ncbi:MAG: ABC transporter substrate-binding protein [Candidatus Hydrogenedentota bacterium]
MKRLVLFIIPALIVSATGCQQREASGKPKVAFIPKGMSHQFWLTVKAGAMAAGEDLDVEVLWNGPNKETQIERQVGIFENMLNLNVDAIVLAACDESALNRPVEQAVAAGIPVVTVDSGVTSDAPLSFVATDNEAGAEAAAHKLAELIGEAGPVGLVPFVSGAATSEMRERGFEQGIAAYEDIEIADVQYSQSDESQGMAVTQDMLSANPDMKGIFGANESSCIGAAQAIKSIGQAGEVKLVCFDAAQEQIAALREGLVQALVVQNPYKMGYESVKAAVLAMRGDEVPPRIDTGVLVVTLENIDDPEVQEILNPEI